jgi:two-component system KDP operon response regulator KdpE
LKLTIDLDTHEVSLAGAQIQLTNKEFEILTVLAKYAPKPVSKDVLAREVWGESDDLIYNRIKYIIHLLRMKMERRPESPQIIQNREGIGYFLAIDQPDTQKPEAA